MEREQSNFAPSRRRLGALLAAGAAVAMPTIPATAFENDARLLAFEVEAERAAREAERVRRTKIAPHEPEFERIAFAPGRPNRESVAEAFAFARTYDRDGAVGEMNSLFDQRDEAIEAALKIKPDSNAGRAAKVRMLVRHHLEHLREPHDELDYDQQLLRAVLTEYAGMTPDDFVAI